MNKLIFIIFLQMTFLSNAFADLDKLLERIENNQLIKKTLENVDIKTNVNLVDLDLADIAFLNTKYRYEVEASFVTKGYLRTDAWKLNTKLSPGHFLKNIGSPLYFGIETNRDIIFVRQFKKQTEALTALPVIDFKKIPVSARAAKENLTPGEFISLPVTMNIVVGAQAIKRWNGLQLSTNGYVGLTGQFTLQALRISEDRLRLRIIADRSRNVGAGISGKLDFDLLNISVVEKLAEKIIDYNFLNLNYSISKGDAIIADYIFDLNNPEAMTALDAVLANPYRFKQLIKGAEQIFRHKEVEQQLISNLDKAEKLFQDDRLLPAEKQRVQRIFLGKNSYISRARAIKVGTNLFNIKSEKGFHRNKITFTEEDGSDSYFYFPTFTKHKKRNFLWNLFKESEEKDTGVLFVSNADFTDFTFTDYVINVKIKDTHLFSREVKKLKRRLFTNFPETITAAFDKLDLITSEQNKATVHAQIVFNSKAYMSIDGTSYDELKNSFDIYAKSIDEKTDNEFKNDITYNVHRSETDLYKISIRKMLETLSFVLNTDPNTKESVRIEALVSLRNNKAFDKFGVGFIMSLLTEEELREFIQVSLSVTSKDLEEPLIFKFGNNTQSEFYENLLKVRSIMGLDLLGLR